MTSSLLNPIITLQNAEGDSWLCSVDHEGPETGERILVSMWVAKNLALTPAALYELVMQRARKKMGTLVKRNLLSARTSSGGPSGS